jgi:hypothetical protein
MEQVSETTSERSVSDEGTLGTPIKPPTAKESHPEASNEKHVSEETAEKSIPVKSLPRAFAERNLVRRYVSKLNLKRSVYCSECGIATPHPAKCLLGASIERSIPEVSNARQILQEIGRQIPPKTVREVPVQVLIPKGVLPEVSIISETKTQAIKRRQPRATAQNNRLLALPAELRMQIYDALLAIPSTVHILEPDKWVKSNIHEVRRFDKELFSRRGRLRYKFSAPCIGYFDPQTTTFAVRFWDNENCTYRAWSTDTFIAGHGVPTTIAQVTSPADLTDSLDGGYVMFADCSIMARSMNKLIWTRMLEQLRLRPEIAIVEFEFPKLCCMITVMKNLLLDVWEGWRELRKVKLLRIRLKHGNGGPLNIWDMMILLCIAHDIRTEMKRKVMLQEGPEVVVAW